MTIRPPWDTVDVGADLTPRTPDERFRAYCLDPAGELQLVATAPDAEGIGLALCTIGAEQQEAQGTPLEQVGILDSGIGKWLVIPWGSR